MLAMNPSFVRQCFSLGEPSIHLISVSDFALPKPNIFWVCSIQIVELFGGGYLVAYMLSTGLSAELVPAKERYGNVPLMRPPIFNI
jgi:hypothetical protein